MRLTPKVIGWISDSAVLSRLYLQANPVHSVEATQSSHWIEVISSIFKQGAEVVDIPRGKVLAREVGFFKESLS